MNVPISQLENNTLAALRRWLLDEHRAVADISSADLVKSLFGIAGVHPSPIDLTEGVISSVKGESEMTLRDCIRKQQGVIWTFTTDLGINACLCKIKDQNGVSSLLILLATGKVGEFTNLRPLVIYNARRVSYYDNNATLNKELEKVNQMFKFTITSDKPATPPKEVKKDELRKEDDAARHADVANGSGSEEGDQDRSTKSGGSRTEEGDNSHTSTHPEETGRGEEGDGRTPESDGPDGDEALNTEEEETDDDLTPDEESPDSGAEEESAEAPSRLTSHTTVDVSGNAKLRDSNWLVSEANKLLQTASQGLTNEEFARQITNIAHSRNIDLDVIGDAKRIELITKPLLLTDSEVLSYWSSAWINQHGDGSSKEDHTDEAIARQFAKSANGRKFVSIERVGEMCTITLNDQEVRFLDPYYQEPEQKVPPEVEAPKEPTFEEQVAKVDAEAIAKGEVTQKEVDKLNEAMEEIEPDHVEEPAIDHNIKITAESLTTEVITQVTAVISEVANQYKNDALKDLGFCFRIINNALEKVIGSSVSKFMYDYQYDETTDTIVINEIKKEPKEMTVRINCPIPLPNEDYQKIKTKITELCSQGGGDLTNDAVSAIVSDDMGYSCAVTVVTPGVEYVVTPNPKDGPIVNPPYNPEAQNTEIDTSELAEEMGSLKDAEPVETDYLDLTDPAIRDRVIQVLFPGVTDPAITHLMHFLKDHHRNERTPSFLATKETIPTETTIVYDNLTFAIVKMKDGRFWRIFCAHTDHGLTDHSWVETSHMEDRWVQLGRDIHDTMNFGFNNNGFRRNFRR